MLRVRTAQFPDAPAIRTLLARAYAPDPLMRWVFPDDSFRLDAAAAWLGLFVEQYVAAGQVQVIDDADISGVAVWRMPGDPLPAAGLLPSVSGLLGLLVGEERAGEVGNALHAISSVTPTGTFAYLQFLAVHPERQHQGFGSALLNAGIAEAEQHGLGVHLETTNPANIAYYQAHGFGTTASLTLPPDGPELWAMFRPSGSHEAS